MTTRVPRGIRNCNPGNLRYHPLIRWRGQVGPDEDGFARFDTIENGIRAACLDVLAGFRQVRASRGQAGEDTVREIIAEWAPPNENNTAAYVQAVARAMDVDPDQVLEPTRPVLVALLRAIFRHENGGEYVAQHELEAGVERALGGTV